MHCNRKAVTSCAGRVSWCGTGHAAAVSVSTTSRLVNGADARRTVTQMDEHGSGTEATATCSGTVLQQVGDLTSSSTRRPMAWQSRSKNTDRYSATAIRLDRDAQLVTSTLQLTRGAADPEQQTREKESRTLPRHQHQSAITQKARGSQRSC